MKRKQIIDKVCGLEHMLGQEKQRELSREEYCLALRICTLWRSQWEFLKSATLEKIETNKKYLIERQEAINLLEKVLDDMKNGDMNTYYELLAYCEEKGESENV